MIVIVRPAGQDVELPCSLFMPGTGQTRISWEIKFKYHEVSSLNNGTLPGYSANLHNSSLIVKNIVMNDTRNGTEYNCVIIMSDVIVNDSDTTFLLYVAGEYLYYVIIISHAVLCIS